MAKSIDDTLAWLESLRHQPPTDATIDELRKALSPKSNFVAAKAAKVIAHLNLAPKLGDALNAAFKHWLSNDKGCAATTAIVTALAAGECGAEETYLAGAKHVQMEGSYGPPVDVAVELRCESLAALVRMNSRQMWDPLVRLLADKEGPVRAVAARALGATGQDAAKWLLQFKILTGDKESSVMGEVFSAICRLTRSIDLVEPFLRDQSEALAEAAAIALGESRLPAAFAALKHELPRATRDFHKVVLISIAMTRQPGSVDCLIEALLEAPLKGDAAMEALAMYRSDSAVREKVRSACEDSAMLMKLFDQHFDRA